MALCIKDPVSWDLDMGEDMKSIPRSQTRTVGPPHQKDKNISEIKKCQCILTFPAHCPSPAKEKRKKDHVNH